MARTTIKDVSDAAGVSIKTVSRVLNKERYVREETRLKVEAAVARLNFHPSFVARTLAGRRSFQIGLIYDNPNAYYVQNMQEGVRARCIESNFRMIVQPCDINSPTLVEDVDGLIDQTHLDGLIVCQPIADAPAVLAALERRGIPFVRIQPEREPAEAAATLIDNAQAADDMTAYLIGLGHRRIGFVEGHPNCQVGKRRRAGFEQAMARAGIPVLAELVQPGAFDFRSGSAAAEALLALAEPPSAIFASSDDMAAGVLATAHRLGVAVPERLSVAGFDDTDLASTVWPFLTTIHQPIRDLGYAAADLLIGTDFDSAERRMLPYELIVRGSTARPFAG